MRLAGCVLVLSAAAAGGDLLEARGDTLATFDVAVHLARIDHSSAGALADSFAALYTQQHAVALRFQRLFRKEHVAILARYFEKKLVEHGVISNS